MKRLAILYFIVFLPLLLLFPLTSEAIEEIRSSRKIISVDFEKTDLHNAFRVISEISNLNIALHKDVKGKISLRLKNVPWDQELEIILRTQELYMVRDGNIMIVYPL